MVDSGQTHISLTGTPHLLQCQSIHALPRNETHGFLNHFHLSHPDGFRPQRYLPTVPASLARFPCVAGSSCCRGDPPPASRKAPAELGPGSHGHRAWVSEPTELAQGDGWRPGQRPHAGARGNCPCPSLQSGPHFICQLPTQAWQLQGSAGHSPDPGPSTMDPGQPATPHGNPEKQSGGRTPALTGQGRPGHSSAWPEP